MFKVNHKYTLHDYDIRSLLIELIFFKVMPGFEPGIQDSKSCVLTITLHNQFTMEVFNIKKNCCLSINLHTVGFEPTKQNALHLEYSPFDHSGKCV